MSNISKEDKEELQILIYSDDFDSVVKGLEQLDKIVVDGDDICLVFDFNNGIPSNMTRLESSLSNVKHKGYIEWMH